MRGEVEVVLPELVELRLEGALGAQGLTGAAFSLDNWGLHLIVSIYFPYFENDPLFPLNKKNIVLYAPISTKQK